MPNLTYISSPETIEYATEQPSFYESLCQGNLELVNYYLEHGHTVNEIIKSPKNGKGTPLFFAAKHGHLEIVKKLCASGADLNLPNDLRHGFFIYDILLASVAYQHPLVTQYLLNQGVVSGTSELYHASINGDIETLELLLSKNNSKEIICPAFANIIYALNDNRHLSSEQINAVIKCFFNYLIGVDINDFSLIDNIFYKRNVAGFNFLGVSVQGDPISPEFLEKNQCSNINQSYFHEKHLGQMEESQKKIVENQLNNVPRHYDQNNCINAVPLYAAAENGKFETVKKRLALNVDPNATLKTNIVGFDYNQPIIAAAINKHVAIVELLASNPAIKLQDVWEAFFYFRFTP